jgi:hypothetical protein
MGTLNIETNSIDVIKKLALQLPDSRWAVWQSVPREGGKVGKIPHKLSASKLIKIGHDDPSQWVDFDTAAHWLNASDSKASGLGLLIGSNPKNNPSSTYSSGLIALDIDGCLGSDGELLDSVGGDVRAAIKALREHSVYFEISPSGTGLRALWKGTKPQEVGERWKNFETSGELYDGSSTRFVTITGNVWKDSPLVIAEPNESLTEDIAEYLGMHADQRKNSHGVSLAPARNLPTLSDKEIENKVKQSGQGKGSRLFNGDMTDYVGDHSSADAALCVLIAKWTDDNSQVARVWGESVLGKREKFKRKDYRERTVNNALERVRSSTSTGSQAATSKAEKIKTALSEGDNDDGVLASVLASWGGKVPASLGGAEKILSLDKRLAGAFAYDFFSDSVLKLRGLHECLGDAVPKDKDPESGDTFADSDTAALTIWLESNWGVALRTSQVHEAVDLSARRKSINSVVDALEALVWDGRLRLDMMLVKYFMADDSQDSPRYLSAIGRAWMVATVARAYQPGCKHDCALTMQGGQGCGKSQSIKTLAEAISPSAFREGLPPLSQAQEAKRALCGTWICELPELSFLDKVTTEAVKSFITECKDSFRHPWGKRFVNMKRATSFVGTTNQDTFVRDPTGARRWWVFRVKSKIDIDKLRNDALQLWAEAVTAYKAGEKWYLHDAVAIKDAETSQGLRIERSGWDDLIDEKIIDALIAGKEGEPTSFRRQASHMWLLVMPQQDMEYVKNTRAFGEALKRRGFVSKLSGGKTIYSVGDDLLDRILKARNNS